MSLWVQSAPGWKTSCGAADVQIGLVDSYKDYYSSLPDTPGQTGEFGHPMSLSIASLAVNLWALIFYLIFGIGGVNSKVRNYSEKERRDIRNNLKCFCPFFLTT